MADNSKSVALLAREGVARDHLREALNEAGANIVLEGDPTVLDLETIRRAAPQVVLIALEPAVEEALDTLAPILEDPALDVIFDEAELAARRNGWEAQRWARHLTAKLRNSDNVLPKYDKGDDSFGTVAAPPAPPVQTSVAGKEPVPSSLAIAVPQAVPPQAVPVAEASASQPPSHVPQETYPPAGRDMAGLEVTESIDLGDVTEMFVVDSPAKPEPVYEFDGLSVEKQDTLPEPTVALEPMTTDQPQVGSETVYHFAENEPVQEPTTDGAVSPPPLPSKFAEHTAAPGVFEAMPRVAAPPPVPESDDGLLTLEEIFRKSTRTDPNAMPSSFGNLELAPMTPPSDSKPKPWDGDSRPIESEPVYRSPPSKPQEAVAAPSINFEELSLVDIEEKRDGHTDGAILVLAGIGGPDAVRKLLAELPEGFSRPMLVQLRLDGGRYDNLVRQISRVSPQPVRLAEADKELDAGTIYVLPDHISLHMKHGVLSFVTTEQQDEIIDVLPPSESAILFLSGSDPKRVEAALMFAGQGGLVGGQSLEGCYDATAVRLLAGNGIELNTPSQLVTQLVERWGMR